MQIDTAIIRASLIADSQISARLADAVVAFVSSLKLWKHCGCLTIHGPQITTWNSSLLWTLSAGVNWAKPEPALPLCLPTGPGDSCRNTYLCYLCYFFFTCVNILRLSMSRWILYHSVTGRAEICYEFLKQCWRLYCMYQPHVGEQIACGGGRAALCIIQWDQTERSESHKEEPIKENIKGDIMPWGKALIQYVLQVTGSICSF